MSKTEEILKKYQNFTPEVVEYDEDVDGGLMPVREKLLDQKKSLKEVFEKKRDQVATKITAR